MIFSIQAAREELALGNRAYQSGDYDTAFTCYTNAMRLGSAEAMSNLGYCYYYGRVGEANKPMAAVCWEFASAKGDICAMYKLGDMCLKGEIEGGREKAESYYKAAYISAGVEKDIGCYPDACLRILRHMADDYTLKTLRRISNEAYEGIKERIALGDTLSDNLLIEAERFREIYGKKD